MNWFTRSLSVLVALTAWASPASACPLCESETGRKVRAGILGDDLGYNLVVTLLLFPVLLAVVLLVHHGIPRGRGGRADQTGGDPTRLDLGG